MKTSIKAGSAALGLTLLIAGCNEGRVSHSASDEAKRRDQALVAVLQCFIDHKVIRSKDLEGQPWLDQDKVQPRAELVEWLSIHRDTVYRGKPLHTWEDEATAAWPDWKCPF